MDYRTYPLRKGELRIEELKDGRFVIDLGDPDDPRITCVELEAERKDLTREEMRTRDVKYAIIGDIPDMDKAKQS